MLPTTILRLKKYARARVKPNTGSYTGSESRAVFSPARSDSRKIERGSDLPLRARVPSLYKLVGSPFRSRRGCQSATIRTASHLLYWTLYTRPLPGSMTFPLRERVLCICIRTWDTWRVVAASQNATSCFPIYGRSYMLPLFFIHIN